MCIFVFFLKKVLKLKCGSGFYFLRTFCFSKTHLTFRIYFTLRQAKEKKIKKLLQSTTTIVLVFFSLACFLFSVHLSFCLNLL